jgi:hypothetical protein
MCPASAAINYCRQQRRNGIDAGSQRPLVIFFGDPNLWSDRIANYSTLEDIVPTKTHFYKSVNIFSNDKKNAQGCVPAYDSWAWECCQGLGCERMAIRRKKSFLLIFPDKG